MQEVEVEFLVLRPVAVEIAGPKVDPSLANCSEVLHLESCMQLLVIAHIGKRVLGSNLRSAAHRCPCGFALGSCDDAGVDGRAPPFVPGGLLGVIDAALRDLDFLHRNEVRRRDREVLRSGVPAAAVGRVEGPMALGDME